MNPLCTVAAALSLLLAGCATLTDNGGSGDRGMDGVRCFGSMAHPTDNLLESANPTLLSMARMPTGKGGVCAAKVFAVTAPVVLYRVFDSSKPHTRLGGWWSLSRPGGSRDDYRAANAICPEWSKLDRVVSCEVRPGTQLVLGTTQSAQCASGAVYAKTSQTQVFVPNDGRAGIIHLGACAEEAAWP